MRTPADESRVRLSVCVCVCCCTVSLCISGCLVVDVCYQWWFLRGQWRRFCSASLWRHRPVSWAFVTVGAALKMDPVFCTEQQSSERIYCSQQIKYSCFLFCFFFLQHARKAEGEFSLRWCSDTERSSFTDADADLQVYKTLMFGRLAPDHDVML